MLRTESCLTVQITRQTELKLLFRNSLGFRQQQRMRQAPVGLELIAKWLTHMAAVRTRRWVQVPLFYWRGEAVTDFVEPRFVVFSDQKVEFWSLSIDRMFDDHFIIPDP